MMMNDAIDTPTCNALRESGDWNANWDSFAQLDPKWTEQFMAMAMVPQTSGVLDAKTVEFLAIAVDAAVTRMYGPGVRRHIRRALEVGAAREEITAVLQFVSVPGIHSMNLAAPMLIEEAAAHEPRAAEAGQTG